MNQGATQHLRNAEEDGRVGRSAELATIDEITVETAVLRRLLPLSLLATTLPSIDLGSRSFLPKAYEAGNMAAIRNSLADLPSAAALGSDLEQFAAIYSHCVGLKDVLAANRRVRTGSRSIERQQIAPRVVPEFKPKDASDYLAHIGAPTQRRTRKQEALIREFGEEQRRARRVPVTNVHPRDLVINDGDQEWLVEAKTVGLNAEIAVCEAIGQLLAYRHFYYRARSEADPRLLALFNAPIGSAFEDLLRSLSIEFISLGSPEAGTAHQPPQSCLCTWQKLGRSQIRVRLAAGSRGCDPAWTSGLRDEHCAGQSRPH
jgi:hypothetical protein